MKTTIAVSDKTRRLLGVLKGESGKSFDKIIREILAEHMPGPRSLAGAYPQLKWNKETDRMKFRGE